MTVEQAKQKLVTWAQAEVGYREGANNYNKYADIPEIFKLYGWKPQNQPWCDTFVDTAFIECFGLEAASEMTYQPIGEGSALCKTSAQYYKDHNAWFKTPEAGDQIFFYVSGDINHTGIVTRVNSGTVVTVEGNSSDMVAERTYSLNDSNRIAGYGRPKWSVVADESERPESGAGIKEPEGNPGSNGSVSDNVQESEKDARYYELRFPYLRRGDTGDAVIAVQFQLAAQGYDIGPDGADGDFGGNTEEAVKEFQLNVGLPADGVVGPDTGARLFGASVYEKPQAEKEKPKQEVKPGTFWNNLLAKIKN